LLHSLNFQNKDKEVSLPQEVMMKHPLQYRWTLWYLEMDKNKTWEEMQMEVTSFETVEDFWSLFNHIKNPSEIKVQNDYSLFKEGIR
jgi:translation initiation factor 4E